MLCDIKSFKCLYFYLATVSDTVHMHLSDLKILPFIHVCLMFNLTFETKTQRKTLFRKDTCIIYNHCNISVTFSTEDVIGMNLLSSIWAAFLESVSPSWLYRSFPNSCSYQLQARQSSIFRCIN